MAPTKLKNHLVVSFLSLGSVSLLFNGCFFSPLPVLEYRASTVGSIWDNGIELHAGKTKDYDLKAGFLEMGEPTDDGASSRFPLFFRISCVNRSRDSVLFDPGKFRLFVHQRDSLLSVIDPDAVIHQTKKVMAVEEARYGSQVVTGAVMDLGAVGLDLVGLFADETKAEKEEWKKTKDDMHKTNQENADFHFRMVADLSKRIRFWSAGSLRKSSLSPGQHIDGRIAFGLRSAFAAPDSLQLQYQESDNRFANLMVFGLVRDTINIRDKNIQVTNSSEKVGLALKSPP